MGENNRGNEVDLPTEPASGSETAGGESPFERLAEDYDAWFDADGKPVFDVEVRGFQAVLPSLPQPWIEIGVGSGRFAEALGIDTGIEPSRNLAEMAESRGIKVVRARGEDRVFPAGSFGTAFLIVTLCFLDDPPLVLRRTWETLKDPGKLVLGLITSESPWARFYLRKKEQGHPFYSIARFYAYEEVLELLRENGFEHESTVSTLFQAPGLVEHDELPREGFFPDAGFIILVAGRKPLGKGL